MPSNLPSHNLHLQGGALSAQRHAGVPSPLPPRPKRLACMDLVAHVIVPSRPIRYFASIKPGLSRSCLFHCIFIFAWAAGWDLQLTVRAFARSFPLRAHELGLFGSGLMCAAYNTLLTASNAQTNAHPAKTELLPSVGLKCPQVGSSSLGTSSTQEPCV